MIAHPPTHTQNVARAVAGLTSAVDGLVISNQLLGPVRCRPRLLWGGQWRRMVASSGEGLLIRSAPGTEHISLLICI